MSEQENSVEASGGETGECRAFEAPAAPENDAAQTSELTDEERAAIRDRNALILAWDRALTDIRQRSYEGKLTTPARWRKLAIAPAGVGAAEFEESLVAYIEEHEHAEDSPALNEPPAPAPLEVQLEGVERSEDDPLPEPMVTDIVLLFGKKATYLYSKPLLSHSFAHALFLTAEDDDLATFIDVVRTESRVYPRPVSRDSFINVPYLWSPTKTAQVFDRVCADGSFEDIRSVTASNGVVSYYSTLYLSDAQARALSEWYEVEKPSNP
ncbi:MAG: hypothetical protein E7001_03180 [Coriobacteriaceae bacterium]|nr:hypothetical protein [Coriobacteriaceae bacterium]